MSVETVVRIWNLALLWFSGLNAEVSRSTVSTTPGYQRRSFGPSIDNASSRESLSPSIFVSFGMHLEKGTERFL